MEIKMASRSIELISQKLAHEAHFFLISKKKKKTNLHVQHTFLSFFVVVLHNYTAIL